jgi:threonylcarbamoyladenosine tRNA methylthiotransferase MtaB
VSYLHVFTFSERPGTVAEQLPCKVPSASKTDRSKRLIALSEQKASAFAEANKGLVTKVLFERTRTDGMITGFTSNYIRIEHPWQGKLAGCIRNVRLTGIAPSGRMSAEITD